MGTGRKDSERIIGCLSCSAYMTALLYAPREVEVGSGEYRSVPVIILCKTDWDYPCGGDIALNKAQLLIWLLFRFNIFSTVMTEYENTTFWDSIHVDDLSYTLFHDVSYLSRAGVQYTLFLKNLKIRLRLVCFSFCLKCDAQMFLLF